MHDHPKKSDSSTLSSTPAMLVALEKLSKDDSEKAQRLCAFVEMITHVNERAFVKEVEDARSTREKHFLNREELYNSWLNMQDQVHVYKKEYQYEKAFHAAVEASEIKRMVLSVPAYALSDTLEKFQDIAQLFY
jgi:hypothetical protein